MQIELMVTTATGKKKRVIRDVGKGLEVEACKQYVDAHRGDSVLAWREVRQGVFPVDTRRIRITEPGERNPQRRTRASAYMPLSNREETAIVKAALKKASLTFARVGHGSGTAIGWLHIQGVPLRQVDMVEGVVVKVTGRTGDWGGRILISSPTRGRA